MEIGIVRINGKCIICVCLSLDRRLGRVDQGFECLTKLARGLPV